jgi:hypothetical protein
MMRFCNESANIGTFAELPTKRFKNIPFILSFWEGTMLATTSTAISSLQMIAFCKNQ